MVLACDFNYTTDFQIELLAAFCLDTCSLFLQKNSDALPESRSRAFRSVAIFVFCVFYSWWMDTAENQDQDPTITDDLA
jgi:hypothetical protein